MRRLILCIFLLLIPAAVQAQTHYCDTAPPTSINAVAGATVTLQWCNDGKDSTGTVTVQPSGFKLYDNAAAGVNITATKGTTSTVSGKTAYTSPYVVPSTPGTAHTLQTTALCSNCGAGGTATEGAKSNVFTVNVVPVVPSAPTNLSGQ